MSFLHFISKTIQIVCNFPNYIYTCHKNACLEKNTLSQIRKYVAVPPLVDTFFSFEEPETDEINLSTYKYRDIIGLFKQCVSGNKDRFRKGFDWFIDTVLDEIDSSVFDNVTHSHFAFIENKCDNSFNRLDISKIKPFKETVLDEVEIRLKPITNKLYKLYIEGEKYNVPQVQELNTMGIYLGWDPRQKNHHLQDMAHSLPIQTAV